VTNAFTAHFLAECCLDFLARSCLFNLVIQLKPKPSTW
jgi:hypothetical protein